MLHLTIGRATSQLLLHQGLPTTYLRRRPLLLPPWLLVPPTLVWLPPMRSTGAPRPARPPTKTRAPDRQTRQPRSPKYTACEGQTLDPAFHPTIDSAQHAQLPPTSNAPSRSSTRPDALKTHLNKRAPPLICAASGLSTTRGSLTTRPGTWFKLTFSATSIRPTALLL